MIPGPPKKRSPSTSRSPIPQATGTLIRVVVMGIMLAFALFFAIFFRPEAKQPTSSEPLVLSGDNTPPPILDRRIVDAAQDETRRQRLIVEESVFGHLLEKGLMVVPSVAQKLGLPEEPIPIDTLRRDPQSFRGQWIYYKGKLESVREKPGHPIDGYKIHEGKLRTEDGEPVLFAVSLPPDEKVNVGSYVRVEGFFMKLRDDHFPRVDQAPLLVGLKVESAYADWDAVEELDPAVLNRVADGRWDPTLGPMGDFINAPEADDMLIESQNTPLWHLAGYARRQHEVKTLADWRKLPAFNTEKQFLGIRDGKIAKGTPFRILGTFITGRTFAAESNPLGIAKWTEAHVQIRELGGKIVPLWIPEDIGTDWKVNATVEARGYLFKRYRFQSRDGATRWSPLFVAAHLDRYELGYNPTHELTLSFVGIALIVIIVLAVVSWRDRRQRAEYERERIERKRRKRGQQPDTPAPAAS